MYRRESPKSRRKGPKTTAFAGLSDMDIMVPPTKAFEDLPIPSHDKSAVRQSGNPGISPVRAAFGVGPKQAPDGHTRPLRANGKSAYLTVHVGFDEALYDEVLYEGSIRSRRRGQQAGLIRDGAALGPGYKPENSGLFFGQTLRCPLFRYHIHGIAA
jgi:hypothetical protein